jgi:hypothetical protein
VISKRLGTQLLLFANLQSQIMYLSVCSVCRCVPGKSPFLGPGCYVCRKAEPSLLREERVHDRSDFILKGEWLPFTPTKCQRTDCVADKEPVYTADGKPIRGAWDCHETWAGCSVNHCAPLCPVCQKVCSIIDTMFERACYTRCCSPEHTEERMKYSDFPECLWPGCRAEQECVTQGWFKGWCTAHAFTSVDMLPKLVVEEKEKE